ncbi:MAG: cytochrome [marine bacterium B5-7]|nr:MAG: cytochrome [marine bacterium B5-7]
MSESQMSNSKFAKLFFTMITLLVVLTLALIVLAFVNTDEVSTRLKEARQKDIDKVVAARVEPVGTLNIGPIDTTKADEDSNQPAEVLSGDAVYQQTCVACHDTGVAGAPKVGDTDNWKQRYATGIDTLYDHALHGFQGNAGLMPAKGGNTSLSDDAVKAAVNHMLVLSNIDGVEEANAADQQAPATEESTNTDTSESTTQPAATTESTGSDATNTSAATDISGEAVYQQGCIACHMSGVAGAPKVGDADNWKQRISTGIDTLHDHAINGFQGSAGVMPAKGGNTTLSDDEVKAAVDYMVSQSQ